MICGAPIGVDRWCRRTLVSAPCPDHRHSSGSKKVRSRAKSQQAVTREPPTGGVRQEVGEQQRQREAAVVAEGDYEPLG